MTTAKALKLPKVGNLLICIEMASRRIVHWIILPAWQCRIFGSVPVLWHWRTFGARKNVSALRRENAVPLNYPERRVIPSLRILC